MLELLAYLHDSELVAGFQRRCGLFLVEAGHHSQEMIRSETGTPVQDEKPRGQMRRSWEHQDNNSNYKYKENGCTTGVSVKLRKTGYLSVSELIFKTIC